MDLFTCRQVPMSSKQYVTYHEIHNGSYTSSGLVFCCSDPTSNKLEAKAADCAIDCDASIDLDGFALRVLTLEFDHWSQFASSYQVPSTEFELVKGSLSPIVVKRR